MLSSVILQIIWSQNTLSFSYPFHSINRKFILCSLCLFPIYSLFFVIWVTLYKDRCTRCLRSTTFRAWRCALERDRLVPNFTVSFLISIKSLGLILTVHAAVGEDGSWKVVNPVLEHTNKKGKRKNQYCKTVHCNKSEGLVKTCLIFGIKQLITLLRRTIQPVEWKQRYQKLLWLQNLESMSTLWR